MSTDYDAVAEEYKRSKLAPWRTYLERYSLLNLLGEVRGKSVLDLACGEGFYSRLVALVHESELARNEPDSQVHHLPRAYDDGLPSSAIRLRM